MILLGHALKMGNRELVNKDESAGKKQKGIMLDVKLELNISGIIGEISVRMLTLLSFERL